MTDEIEAETVKLDVKSPFNFDKMFDGFIGDNIIVNECILLDEVNTKYPTAKTTVEIGKAQDTELSNDYLQCITEYKVESWENGPYSEITEPYEWTYNSNFYRIIDDISTKLKTINDFSSSIDLNPKKLTKKLVGTTWNVNLVSCIRLASPHSEKKKCSFFEKNKTDKKSDSRNAFQNLRLPPPHFF